MINFVNFINEAKDKYVVNTKAVSAAFMRYYSKMSGSEYVYVYMQKFTNKYGKMLGYVYINGLHGMRHNFKNKKLHSISYWDVYSSKAPDRTVLINVPTKNSELIKVYPKVYGALTMTTSMDLGNGYIEPIVLPDGETCDTTFEAIEAMYDEGYSLAAMVKIFRNQKYHMSVTKADIIKALKLSGLDISDIGTREYVRNKNVTNDDVKPNITVYNDAEETIEAETDDIAVEENVAETVEENKYDKLADEELVNQLIADPLPVFRSLNSYVLMTAKRINNGLLITGQGGVGKTYNVTRILSTFGTEGKDYVIMKGASSTAAMYQFLYNNYNKIVVFDDCDSVLTDDDAVNILKGALDSGKTRKISYNKRGTVDTFGCTTHEEIEDTLAAWSAANKGKVGIPSTFNFQGGCIFISNLSVEKMEQGKAAPLLTRCMRVDINLLAKDIILRMESCLPSIKVYDMDGKDITDENLKKEVFEWISSDTYLKDPRIKGKEISFRLFSKCYMFRYARLPEWKELCFCI